MILKFHKIIPSHISTRKSKEEGLSQLDIIKFSTKLQKKKINVALNGNKLKD